MWEYFLELIHLPVQACITDIPRTVIVHNNNVDSMYIRFIFLFLLLGWMAISFGKLYKV